MDRRDNTNYVGYLSGKKTPRRVISECGSPDIVITKESIDTREAVHLKLIGQTYSHQLSQVRLLVQMKLYGISAGQRRGVDCQVISQHIH